MGNYLYHHFQPIIDIHESKIFGYESLLRSKDAVNPESLFCSAVNSNTLFELDTLSFIKAIQSFSSQIDKHTSDIHLFLNIYPSTLVSSKFLNVFVDIIESSLISPNRIVLEINESEQIKSYSLLKKAVFKLQSLGLQVALDDFDKGISPFQKVLELEPNYIKLDKYFSTNLTQSVNKQKLIKLLLKYCSANNIKIILEGIETDNDLSVAKSLGVDFGQGFLFGRPDILKKCFRSR